MLDAARRMSWTVARAGLGFVRHVRADARRGVLAGHFAADLARLFRGFASGGDHSHPPHALQIYHDCLARLAADPRCRVVSLADHVTRRDLDTDGVNVVLRHDVDSGVPAVTAALCAADRQAGFRSSVHVLVDGELYDPRPLVPLLDRLQKDGFDVGLHTQAWMQDDCVASLRADLTRFEALTRRQPRTLTLHGAWPRTQDDLTRRRRFEQALPSLLAGTSLVGYNNRFDWVAEDSNVAGRPHPISRAFLEVNERCYLGGVALILTHDSHWQVDGG